ncbi:hypothetical protein, partial [Paenibacillus sp. AR247]|uniref:hypothetical protein n=1 Tax=Paenibacillus sp. AR247 TaxID=1631599 RepID=UPI001C61654E
YPEAQKAEIQQQSKACHLPRLRLFFYLTVAPFKNTTASGAFALGKGIWFRRNHIYSRSLLTKEISSLTISINIEL